MRAGAAEPTARGASTAQDAYGVRPWRSGGIRHGLSVPSGAQGHETTYAPEEHPDLAQPIGLSDPACTSDPTAPEGHPNLAQQFIAG